MFKQVAEAYDILSNRMYLSSASSQFCWKLLEMCDCFPSLPTVPILHFFTRVLLLALKIANDRYQLCWVLKIFFHSKGCDISHCIENPDVQNWYIPFFETS